MIVTIFQKGFSQILILFGISYSVKSAFLLCKNYFMIFQVFFTYFGFISTNMGFYSELSSSIYPASLFIFWKQQGKYIFQSDRFP